ncbi:MAG: beta-lactamase family protein [Parvibaculum sp.]|uniref:serine hydrolase domain-containing protein n=1 Tax=Parvibaculum sp. TaxID=2024848 RepID=UPI0025F29FA8|nr:serine hydrolase domain-containing protein [Parvibaculum sp.]MCE9649705.1 beta-lactamase family protein [Parvibaculum sp.]
MPDLDTLLEDLVRAHGVPGATLAVWTGGSLRETAAGVVNLETQVPATAEALFQIGSITKLYTAALCLQLVEEGKLSLDEPVRKWLPDFRLADESVAARLTLRHLLSHRSGIEGDFWREAGRGEDRIARFVSMLGELGQVHPIDAMFSYCNTGFVIAGRLIEVAGGMPWDKAMRSRIAKPIGTPAFSTLPEQAMRYLTAIGHLGAPGSLAVTPIAYLAQSNAPAGSTPMARARDVVTFARMLMAGGVAPNGTRILSEASVKAMHEMNTVCPARMNIDAIGLATFMWDWDGDGVYDTFGHDGSTIGQAAWLRYHPASGTAAALLTNGGNGKGMAQELMSEIFGAAAGATPPPPPVATPGFKFDAHAYEGRYANSMETIEVSAEDGKLIATITPSASASVISGVKRVAIEPVNAELFVGVAPGYTENATYHFLTHEGRRYLHSGVRAHGRVDA